MKSRHKKSNDWHIIMIIIAFALTVVVGMGIQFVQFLYKSNASELTADRTQKQGSFNFPTTAVAPPTSGVIPTIPSPTRDPSKPLCPYDAKKPDWCGSCHPGEWDAWYCNQPVALPRSPFILIPDDPNYDVYKNTPICPDNWCLAKPVIYLYPTKKMSVDVRLEIPGKVIVSDPLYPDGGWENILAYPNGNLEYRGKKYHELFFESQLDTDIKIPGKGVVIAKQDEESVLRTLTTQLGLNTFEQQEFIEYWLPALQDLPQPYLFISFIEHEEKQRIDKVVIHPQPDTMIELIAYFKPLEKSYNALPLDIPSQPPQRKGFTAVEWGGTIDR